MIKLVNFNGQEMQGVADSLSAATNAVEDLHNSAIMPLIGEIQSLVAVVDELRSELHDLRSMIVVEAPEPRMAMPTNDKKNDRAQRVIDLYVQGWKYTEICNELQESLPFVKNCIHRYHVPDRTSASPVQRKDGYKRTHEKSKEKPGDLRKPPSNKLERDILQAYLDGVSFREMAKRFDMTHGQIASRVYKMIVPGGKAAQRKAERDSKRRYKKVLTCPHCGHEGKGATMYMWHFDNCRQNI